MTNKRSFVFLQISGAKTSHLYTDLLKAAAREKKFRPNLLRSKDINSFSVAGILFLTELSVWDSRYLTSLFGLHPKIAVDMGQRKIYLGKKKKERKKRRYWIFYFNVFFFKNDLKFANLKQN